MEFTVSWRSCWRTVQLFCIVGGRDEAVWDKQLAFNQSSHRNRQNTELRFFCLQVWQIKRLPSLLVSRQKQGELLPQGLRLLPRQTPLLLPLLPRLSLVLLLLCQRQPRASGDPDSAHRTTATTSYLSSLRRPEHRHKHRHKHRQPEPRRGGGERRLRTSTPHQLVLRYSRTGPPTAETFRRVSRVGWF